MGEGKRQEVVLSIETAIQGGSLSLLENGEEIDCWLGQAEVSKAEDVLEQIKNLLERNSFKKETLKLIVVSAGPGSSTGVKIGLSLAKGLRKALDCEFIQIPVLESLLLKAQDPNAPVATALPIGKDLICRQSFANAFPLSDVTEARVTSRGDFIEWLTKYNYSEVVCHDNVFSFLLSKKDLFGQSLIVNAGLNMARLMAYNGINNYRRVR